jgi:RNA polymerase sigma factor (sigma-70 family)
MTDLAATRAGGRGFPATRHSLLSEIRSGDAAGRERALDVLAGLYWRPVYKYLRVKWRLDPPDAEDLTQEFFGHVVARDLFAGYDPSKSRFRTFLRVCLDRFASNRRRDAGRKKRGGGAVHVPLDFEAAEGELGVGASHAADPDEFFRREWVRSLFGLALENLRVRCGETGRETHFALFERCDVDVDDGPRPTYRDLAEAHGIAVTQVTNYLALARREFRRLVLEALRAATASDEEFRAEARELLGIDPP